ncbi:hypothetical protein ACIBIZ_14010 [Nonomuraea spiralis]|uniref:hypothetical protein n=1 Tax=Nonomuraea TaxID=83681 RepID=UPI00163C8045|nr:hypothetical protein [Nonomuraea sp. WAC 01424]
MRAMTRWADRLLEKVAPHTVARATDCDWETSCPNPTQARYCCYYPNGHRYCGRCQ